MKCYGTVRCALPLLLGTHAAGQTYLYGLRANGDLLRIDPTTGGAAWVGGISTPTATGAPRRRG
jgi:hypothetical protein